MKKGLPGAVVAPSGKGPFSPFGYACPLVPGPGLGVDGREGSITPRPAGVHRYRELTTGLNSATSPTIAAIRRPQASRAARRSARGELRL